MENKKYLQSIREELEAIYKGETLTEEGEQKSFYDYISEDVLDYDFTLNSQKELTGCRLWVTLGGPNVWIDTNDNEIKLAWGTDRESDWLPSEIAEEINDIMREFLQY